MQQHLTPWEDRFWAKVREGESGCWLWTGARVSTGYGQFGNVVRGPRAGRTCLAHRIAWELVVGLIPRGLTLDHLCRNILCVNPAHLEPVTVRENILRGQSPAAENARKTHCKRGHALSGANLYVVAATGGRRCRACQAMKHAEWLAR